MRAHLLLVFYVVFVGLLLCVLVNDEEETNYRENLLELTLSMNLARQKRIQEACDHFPPNNASDFIPRQLFNIVVDDEHKLLYCYVPKVASTNWKKMLMILTGKWNSTDALSIPNRLVHNTPFIFKYLSTVEKQERDYLLENYHKMIIVRNPFERLLSAYRNKFENQSQDVRYFHYQVGRRIIKVLRKNPSNDSLEHGNDVTFKEFAMFLTNKSEELADVVNEEHWQPMTDLCHPCRIKYTLIGKFETLLDDSVLALHTINVTHLNFPHLARTSGTAEKLHKYFSQLDLPLIMKLFKYYEQDYRIFDYNLDNIMGLDL